MNAQEISRRVQEALSCNAVPPRPSLPEANCSDDALSLLFSLLVMCECLSEFKRPRCVRQDCMCIPSVKQYKIRVVEVVEYKARLLYAKYLYTGASRCSFSTISSSYLHAQVETIAHFPFHLSRKTGFSKRMLTLVHHEITSPNGLSSTIASVKRARQNRYYTALCIMSDRARTLAVRNSAYPPPYPLPPNPKCGPVLW